MPLVHRRCDFRSSSPSSPSQAPMCSTPVPPLLPHRLQCHRATTSTSAAVVASPAVAVVPASMARAARLLGVGSTLAVASLRPHGSWCSSSTCGPPPSCLPGPTAPLPPPPAGVSVLCSAFVDDGKGKSLSNILCRVLIVKCVTHMKSTCWADGLFRESAGSFLHIYASSLEPSRVDQLLGHSLHA